MKKLYPTEEVFYKVACTLPVIANELGYRGQSCIYMNYRMSYAKYPYQLLANSCIKVDSSGTASQRDHLLSEQFISDELVYNLDMLVFIYDIGANRRNQQYSHGYSILL